MLYQSDAHHYRALIKRKQRKQRAFGSFLIILSITLMFYAIPGFAVSVFDYDDQVVGGIAFSQSVSDHDEPAAATATGTASAAKGEAAAGVASAAGAVVMSETVGPAMLANEAAVDSAIKRAQAMQVVTSAQSTMITAKAVSAETPVEQPDRPLGPALIAFAAAVGCAILGLRMITNSRRMLGRRITAEYGSALRAC